MTVKNRGVLEWTGLPWLVLSVCGVWWSDWTRWTLPSLFSWLNSWWVQLILLFYFFYIFEYHESCCHFFLFFLLFLQTARFHSNCDSLNWVEGFLSLQGLSQLPHVSRWFQGCFFFFGSFFVPVNQCTQPFHLINWLERGYAAPFCFLCLLCLKDTMCAVIGRFQNFLIFLSQRQTASFAP